MKSALFVVFAKFSPICNYSAESLAASAAFSSEAVSLAVSVVLSSEAVSLTAVSYTHLTLPTNSLV